MPAANFAVNSVSAAEPALFRSLKKMPSPVQGIQIWRANLETISPEERQALGAALTSAEQKRAAQFHFARDRNRYVAARGLLRHLLGAALEKSPASLCFENGGRGKPRLLAGSGQLHPLRFNLSHSGEQALFALAWNRELGIDIESTERAAGIDEGDGLAKRVLSKDEWGLWQTLPDLASRRAIFFRAWTRKEAFVKATGAGLASDLRSITVMEAERPGEIGWKKTCRGWAVHDLAAPPDYVAALAVAQGEI